LLHVPATSPSSYSLEASATSRGGVKHGGGWYLLHGGVVERSPSLI
jgi:hypothetical protein